jgi:prepilin-type processing-associated H-X9-DG protein
MDDPVNGICGKTISWVPEPTLYILLHERPAKRYTVDGEDYYIHWHYAKGLVDIARPQLARDPQKFISNILFVDGHAAKHDFTQALKSEPDFPYEPTKDWVWYKPVRSR